MTPILRECMVLLMLLWQAPPAPPAAIVESLTGTVSLVEPQQKSLKPVQPFDWLAAGSSLSVGRQSVIVVVFSNGSRWELGAGAMATLGTDGPTRPQGKVRSLGSVPPLPRVAPIAGRPPQRAGAVRLRSGVQRIRDLYPFSGASTVPDKTSLRFSPVEGITTYQVEIQDDKATRVFRVETKTTEVTVPPGLLKADSHYSWEVRGAGAVGPRTLGETTFDTLSIENLGRRNALHGAIPNRDATSLALLAEIDIALGLFKEGMEGLTAALALRPDDRVLQIELQQLQQRMRDARD